MLGAENNLRIEQEKNNPSPPSLVTCSQLPPLPQQQPQQPQQPQPAVSGSVCQSPHQPAFSGSILMPSQSLPSRNASSLARQVSDLREESRGSQDTPRDGREHGRKRPRRPPSSNSDSESGPGLYYSRRTRRRTSVDRIRRLAGRSRSSHSRRNEGYTGKKVRDVDTEPYTESRDEKFYSSEKVAELNSELRDAKSEARMKATLSEIELRDVKSKADADLRDADSKVKAAEQRLLEERREKDEAARRHKATEQKLRDDLAEAVKKLSLQKESSEDEIKRVLAELGETQRQIQVLRTDTANTVMTFRTGFETHTTTQQQQQMQQMAYKLDQLRHHHHSASIMTLNVPAAPPCPWDQVLQAIEAIRAQCQERYLVLSEVASLTKTSIVCKAYTEAESNNNMSPEDAVTTYAMLIYRATDVQNQCRSLLNDFDQTTNYAAMAALRDERSTENQHKFGQTCIQELRDQETVLRCAIDDLYRQLANEIVFSLNKRRVDPTATVNTEDIHLLASGVRRLGQDFDPTSNTGSIKLLENSPTH